MAEAADTTLTASAPEYPAFFIEGTSRELMADTSAAVEPEMPEKRTSATTTTMARPPRTWPTIAMARSTIRSEIAPGLHERAGQDEERNGQKDERVDAAQELDGQDGQADAADAHEVGGRGEGQGEGERQTEGRR